MQSWSLVWLHVIVQSEEDHWRFQVEAREAYMCKQILGLCHCHTTGTPPLHQPLAKKLISCFFLPIAEKIWYAFRSQKMGHSMCLLVLDGLDINLKVHLATEHIN